MVSNAYDAEELADARVQISRGNTSAFAGYIHPNVLNCFVFTASLSSWIFDISKMAYYKFKR